jgi:D-sedoheptulose 7-phosphate isomerase
VNAKILSHFSTAADVLSKFSSDPANIIKIEFVGQQMVHCLKAGNKIISCGNGGSLCDAMHFAEELSGRYRDDRKPLAAISISDPGHITCVGNDYGFDEVFSRYIDGIGKKGDILMAISTSGNSKNILNAAKKAKEKGIMVIALTGNDGGALAALADTEIRVPHFGYADRIQEVHIKIIHALIDYIEFGMFGS